MIRSSRLGAAALAGFVTLAWGFAWPVTKIAVAETPVWHLRSINVLGAALLMLALVRVLGHRLRPAGGELVPLAFVAQLNITAWVILSAYGVAQMQAGRAAIIGFTMPAWAAIFGVAIGQERMSLRKFVAIVLGIAALAVLILPDWQEIVAAPLGVGAMLGAAVCWAVGIVAMKHIHWTLSAAAQAGWQLLFAAVPIALITPFIGENFSPAALDWAGWTAIAYLVVISMVLAVWAWFAVVEALPATIAGIAILAVPVVGIISSAWWLGESVGWPDITALALIAGSVLLAMREQADNAVRREPAPAALDQVTNDGLARGGQGE